MSFGVSIVFNQYYFRKFPQDRKMNSSKDGVVNVCEEKNGFFGKVLQDVRSN